MVKGVKTGVSIALVGILAGGGGAYAATQITSAQIKDGTIQAKDIKRGTISTTNLSAAAKKAMTGPAGASRCHGHRGPRPGRPGRRAGRQRTHRARLPGHEGRQGRSGRSGPRRPGRRRRREGRQGR